MNKTIGSNQTYNLFYNISNCHNRDVFTTDLMIIIDYYYAKAYKTIIMNALWHVGYGVSMFWFTAHNLA